MIRTTPCNKISRLGPVQVDLLRKPDSRKYLYLPMNATDEEEKAVSLDREMTASNLETTDRDSPHTS